MRARDTRIFYSGFGWLRETYTPFEPSPWISSPPQAKQELNLDALMWVLINDPLNQQDT
jgi:hypothetical protein